MWTPGRCRHQFLLVHRRPLVILRSRLTTKHGLQLLISLPRADRMRHTRAMSIGRRSAPTRRVDRRRQDMIARKVENSMTEDDSHSWVRQFRQRVGWGLQAIPTPHDSDPTSRVMAAGRLADTLGFDAFFIGDHPAYAPEVWVHLGALAVQTSRIRLGSVVLCAGYRPPVLTARLAADLDNLSGGRVILGLGHGWNATEFRQLGLPFPPVRKRQAALAESIEIIHGVWGPEPFTYHGHHHSTEKERVVPPPLQQPSPPLILAGSGERTALRLVARYADAGNFGAG